MFATKPDSADGDPWECSDGRYIVFLSRPAWRQSSQNVWRADASGGNLKQLSSSKQDNYPVCAPDSRSVYYLDGGTGALMQVLHRRRRRGEVVGRAPRRVLRYFSRRQTAGVRDRRPCWRARRKSWRWWRRDTGEVRKVIEFERPRFGA